MLELYNAGNHAEEPGAHYQYEDFKLQTPRNSSSTGNQYVKVIDQDLYTDAYLAANPNTVIPPACKKITTSFLLTSADTDSQFITAICTMRINLWDAGTDRFSLDIMPLSMGDDLARSVGAGLTAYDDLLHMFIEDKGGGRFNVKLFIKYYTSFVSFRIKSIMTQIWESGMYSTENLDLLQTKNNLYKYPTNEHFQNDWLWIPQTSMSIVDGSTLPSVGSGISKITLKSTATNYTVFSLPTASEQFEGKILSVISGTGAIPYICIKNGGAWSWKKLVYGDLIVNGPAGNARGITFQTDGVDRWYFRMEDDVEAGSNTGSSLAIIRRRDDGTYLGKVVGFNRSTGEVSFTDGPFAVAGIWEKPFHIGTNYFWVNPNNGFLYLKYGSAPTGDTDGGVVPRRVPVPVASNSLGVVGDYALDSSYRYECVATNTWRRTALSTW